MTEKVNFISNYICNICNKEYSSQSSLCNHNKKFHQKKCNKIANVQSNVQSNNKVIKSLTCEFCNKLFNSRSTKSMHKKNVKKLIKLMIIK